jgi:predicted transposase/invertase (TIGR01784 family)
MSFDNLCKLLSEKHPHRFAEWVLGSKQSSVKVLEKELSIEPIRADSVILLRLEGRILHLEFQTKLKSEPPLPLRMLDYWVRLYRLYRLPITQVVVLLLPPAEGSTIETAFEVESTRHEYRVIRLWEEDPTPLLNDPALLPLASLAASTDPEALLQDVAQKVTQLAPEIRSEVSGYTQILAGLKFEKRFIKQMFREGMMRESVIYQDILQEGKVEGKVEGREEGKLEEARSLILRLLVRRVGTLPETLQSRINLLSVTNLETLGEALLDFSQLADLESWFEHFQQ